MYILYILYIYIAGSQYSMEYECMGRAVHVGLEHRVDRHRQDVCVVRGAFWEIVATY